MTDPGEPTPPIRELSSIPSAGRGFQVATVVKFFEFHRGRYTEEALIRSAIARGYPADVVEEARVRARANEVSAPTRHRARRWIVAGYLLTFALLTIGMFVNPGAEGYGGRYIGTVILAATLVMALLISLGWLGWSGRGTSDQAPAIALLLSVPLVLLITVAGLCVATGLPIPRQF